MPLDPAPQQILKPQTPALTGNAAKLASLTIALCDLIARETNLLHARNPREAQKLHGEKSRLMAEYKDTLGKLRVNDAVLGAQNSNERKYIRQLTDKLREIIRDHARIVLRLKSVTEGLIRSVGEEVTKKTNPIVGYSKTAAFHTSRAARPTSLSLNQVI